MLSQHLSFLCSESPTFCLTTATAAVSASSPAAVSVLLTNTTKWPFSLCNSFSSPPFSSLYLSTSSGGFRNLIIRRRESKLRIDTCCGLGSEMSPCNEVDEDPRIQNIKTKIRVVPDFPKPGIMFQDITTLLLDPSAFKNTIDLFVERYKDKNIAVVAGIEARGFIFGPPIALAIGAKFVPLRKPKKLPGAVISEEYVLEYGSDCIEMHVGAVEKGERALVVDDLVATGGTLCAAMNLLERAGAEVAECACVIELPDLKGRERLKGKPLFILVEAH